MTTVCEQKRLCHELKNWRVVLIMKEVLGKRRALVALKVGRGLSNCNLLS